jgi:tetrahydrodipicolinate N-succinyltransferase
LAIDRVIDKVIIDKQVVIGANAVVGYGDDLQTPNAKQPDKVNTGISVIGKNAHIPANCHIGGMPSSMQIVAKPTSPRLMCGQG